MSLASKKKSKEDKSYELLLENQVEFVQSSILAGIQDTKKRKKEASESMSESEIE